MIVLKDFNQFFPMLLVVLTNSCTQQHRKNNLYPFELSLFGSLAPSVLRFVTDFKLIVENGSNNGSTLLDNWYFSCFF
ncbi:hypothetical protein P9112_004670 [Eukaryota sp. TZLM1-RC]